MREAADFTVGVALKYSEYALFCALRRQFLELTTWR
jgi:hypothetical protein